MFCIYCGSYTDNEESVCNDCATKDKMIDTDLFGDLSIPPVQQSQAATPPVAPAAPAVAEAPAAPDGITARYGMVYGIVGGVLATISMLFTYLAAIMTNAVEKLGQPAIDDIRLYSSIGIVCAAFGLVLSILSSRKARYARRFGVSAVVARVFGIIGTILSALMLFCTAIFLMYCNVLGE